MRRIVISLIALVTLVACGGAATEPTSPPAAGVAQLAPTATTAPTAVPTKIPLKDLDLEALLIQPGDLPSGFAGAQVRDEAPAMFKDAPPPVQAVNQQLERDGTQRGGITVLLYDNSADAQTAYADTADGFTDAAKEEPGVGEKATIMAQEIGGVQFADGVMIRCGAVAHVRFTQTKDPENAIAYLKRLDKRLQPLVCP